VPAGCAPTHERPDGFSVTATRTIAAEPDRLLEAFTDTAVRDHWLPDAPMTRRRTSAALTARFDWPDPASRVVVNVAPKADGRAVLSIAHERLPDAEVAARLKAHWRDRLAALKTLLEAPAARR
jgi:uncharacterized protein YndB with AHSA1/START domain